MSEPAIAKLWPRHWCCYVCWRVNPRPPCGFRLGHRVHAVIRIFSGIGGGGFPACREHASIAEDAALRTLLSGEPIADGYKVVAHEVITDDDGDPKLGRTLWQAKRIARC